MKFHVLQIANMTINRLCNTQVITAVNGMFPGPTSNVRESDTVVIHAINNSPYNITLHWHSIFQLLSGWADGPQLSGRIMLPLNLTSDDGLKI